MSLLSLLVLLAFAPVPAQQHTPECHALADSVLSAYSPSRLSPASQQEQNRFIYDGQRARSCLDAHADSLAFKVLDVELHVLNFQKRYREALFRLKEADHYYISSTDSANLSQKHHWLAHLNERLSRPIESASYMALAATLTPVSDTLLYAQRLITASHRFELSNRYEVALEYALLADRLLREVSGDDAAFLLATAKLNVAAYIRSIPEYLAQPEYFSLALESIHESIDLAQRGYAHMSTYGLALYSAGSLYLRQARFDLALDYAKRCLVFSSKHGHTRTQVYAHRLLGDIFLAGGDFSKSQEQYLDALGLLPSLHGPYRGPMGIPLYLRLGSLYEKLNNLRQAEDTYRQAIDLIEASFSALSTYQSLSDPIDNWQTPYRRLTRLLLVQQKTKEAFLIAEQARGRFFLNQRTFSFLLSDFSEESRLQLDSLGKALEEARDSLLILPRGSQKHSSFVAQEAHLESEINQFLGISASPPLFSIPSLQRQLEARQQVLLSYFIDGNEVNPQSHVFVASADSIHAVPLDIDSDRLSDLLAQVHVYVSEVDTSVAPSNQFDLGALHQLYLALFRPLEPYLEDQVSLVIVPDEELFRVPFGALIREKWPRFLYADAPYLIRKHPISIELSATSLLHPPPRYDSNRTEVVAFGLSDFSHLSTNPDLSSSANSLRALPQVEHEFSVLEKRFSDVRLFKNEDATKASFLEHLTSAKVIHFASHSLLHPSSSFYHSLMFYPSVSDSRSDGRLYLHQLMRRTIEADLIVLNGCNTAVGDLSATEGMLGFHQAFRALGVHSSLASLWYAEDFSSSTLVQKVYSFLAEGYSKDAALQQATLEFWDEQPSQYQNPFYWASFVLYGDTTPIQLTRRFNFPFAVLVITLLILSVIAVFLYSRKRFNLFHAH